MNGTAGHLGGKDPERDGGDREERPECARLGDRRPHLRELGERLRELNLWSSRRDGLR
ncbi:hypothetical protein M4914_07315 [Streptomyces somaliensis DSM 40738]|uniref:Uncharacterized protein n=1 Tax=Streptomyces somaliensis (strain ATCC 33201 / DSM 40738 / JCM 12659 / KCTC 9044 / NCTC 11332 / NRRL B-12077 / IP 733) TaxID=1134445 RepID=A0AA44DEF6_STRE0|nr:hypothetical protein [Streptomyces somaliensis]MCQ0022778.1 hypothetical protein [Streptomyces somaliensis DSM 40738]NKY14636.1 hypothetical protein [Streptomyces somaliensis DSM 40738]